ncbi:MAG: hypothetical protein CUN55_18850 [Phototrophicales bacterium]|nr:MAG: hypothetical protein CUN55_18850 [Phototrophicales bacterium]
MHIIEKSKRTRIAISRIEHRHHFDVITYQIAVDGLLRAGLLYARHQLHVLALDALLVRHVYNQ